MKICVVGTGYVGLVVGVCLSDRGHYVCCIDRDAQKISNLQKGILPIYEPGLEEIVTRNVQAGTLRCSTDAASEIAVAEVIYIAVGTPSSADGSANLGSVKTVAKQIAEHASPGAIVVIKSTVPVGTADMVREILDGSHVVDVVSNPEFLREGVAIEDFEAPDRIVVGFQQPEARIQMEKLYASFIADGHPVYFMDNRSAEITKYAANSLLATKISFANELARLCDAAGADIDAVRLGTGSDSRIGAKFLYAGVGYGGSCFPKDVKALIHMASQVGVTMQIAQAVETVNASQKTVLMPKIVSDFGEDLTGRRFAMWGLAFKPQTDDIREAPALYMIEALRKRGASVVAYDPEAMSNVQNEIGSTIDYAETAEEALDNADALILMTEWSHFKSPQWSMVAERLKGRYVYDGRNIYDPSAVRTAGLKYCGIGRGV